MTSETRPQGRRFLALIIILVLVVNAVLGVFLIIARAQAQEGDARDAALVACVVRYNERQTEALEARDARAQESTREAIELWEELRDTLNQQPDDGTTALVTDSIDEYLDALEKARDTRTRTPYPPVDLCRPRSAGD